MKAVLLGVGNMGSTMAKAWLGTGTLTAEDLTLFDTDPKKLAEASGLESKRIHASVAEADFIILAVKPQDLESVAKQLEPDLKGKSIILSILAGVSLAKLSQSFPKNTKIVRAMPNMAAKICQSMTAYVASSAVEGHEKKNAEKLLSALGEVENLSSEELMDAWCAVAGSGPGFILAVMEDFVASAVKQGFSLELAQKMVKQTFYGTASFAHGSKTMVEELKPTVISKGGTTEAGLKVYDAKQVGPTIDEMIQAATERGRQLNQGK